MRIKVGEVEAIFRYPVKSMAGERLNVADLGWHGVEGDRRLAFRRLEDRGGFPWLTASKLPDLLLFTPMPPGRADAELPSRIRTPEGRELEVFGSDLAADVAARHGSPVAMMHLNRGIFDEASISVMASATINEIGRLSGQPPDVRRFRPNIVIRSLQGAPFEEDGWVGGVLSVGDGSTSATISVTNWDERCAMVNFDPESARPTPEVLKAIARVRDNRAGVYAAVTRRGRIAVGQPVFFEPMAGSLERL